MRTLQGWWLGGAAAGALLAGAFYIGCSRLSRPGWSGGLPEAERQARLEDDWEHVDRRVKVLRYLAVDLAEGRVGLRQAAEVARQEDLSSPHRLMMRVEYLPGRTEAERYGECLLRHVDAMLEGDARGPAVLARLRAELQALSQDRPAPGGSTGAVR